MFVLVDLPVANDVRVQMKNATLARDEHGRQLHFS